MDLLWIDFANSEWHDWRGDGHVNERLVDEQWLQKFLAKWDLDRSVLPSDSELPAAIEFRNELRRFASIVAEGGTLVANDITFLNSILAQGPVVRRVCESGSTFRVSMQPLTHGWPQVLADIAFSFTRTLTADDTRRIRICNNPNCLWVFYDETRNRSKKYCDDKLCGNLMKVRRFRDKHKNPLHVKHY